MTPDILPPVVDTPAEFDEDGKVTKEATYVPGVHVNFRADVLGLEEYLVDPQPKTPTRVYQGQMPVCYCFPDKETFREHFPEPEPEA